MAKFLDSVFRIVGFCSLQKGSEGSALPIFESVENSNTFFAQSVANDRIVDFVKFKLSFEDIGGFAEVFYKRGDPAVYCFVSSHGVDFGARRAICDELKKLIEQKLIDYPAMLDAAYIMQDEKLIASLLDQRYLELNSVDAASARFFLVNNLLRDRVIDDLDDLDHKDVLKNTEIDIVNKSLYIKFPEKTDKHTQILLKSKLDATISASSAFSEASIAISNYKDKLADRIAHFLSLMRFDMKFTLGVLQRQRAREFCVPVSLVRLKEELRQGDNQGFESLLVQVYETLECYKRKSTYEKIEAFITKGDCKGFGMNEALEFSAIIKLLADENKIRIDKTFEEIRCCLFYCRSLKYLSSSEKYSFDDEINDKRSLFCVNAATRRFDKSSFDVDVVVTDYIGVSEIGEVDPLNFEADLNFGLDDGIIEKSILGKLSGRFYA